MTGVRIGRFGYLAFCACVFIFLVAPIIVIVPLSFNAEPYFTFTEGMLRLDPEAWSLRWYREIVENEAWTRGLVNSLVIGVSATLLATALGTLAALGLSNPALPARRFLPGLLISPMVTPVIISAAGMFFFYTNLGLAQTHLGLILAHATLGLPFVVITVVATLSAFDRNLTRAAASLGAGPMRIFRTVQLPLIAPGVISGALFAFASSVGGGGARRALHGRAGAADDPAPDVGRDPRTDQPRNPRRRNLPGRVRARAPADRRMAPPPRVGLISRR